MYKFLETCNTVMAVDTNNKASTVTGALFLLISEEATPTVRVLSLASLAAVKAQQPAIASALVVTASVVEHITYWKKHGAIKATTRSFKLSLAMLPVLYVVKKSVGSW